jgi:tetratricopeptide (TPR) repeat protein
MNKINILLLLSGILFIASACGPNPRKARIHLENAIEKIYMAKFDEAMRELELVLRYDPNSHEGYYYRGACKRNLGDVDGAMEDFQKSIEKNPRYAEPYFGIALIYELRQDRDSACSYYIKAEELGKPNLEDYTKWCK